MCRATAAANSTPTASPADFLRSFGQPPEDLNIMTTSTIGFATHGDLLKHLYLAFGVLPRKETRDDDFDETRKKTLQSQLSRLAAEQGKLIENYLKAIDILHQQLRQYFAGTRTYRIRGHVAG
jgi:hypothetical protein